MTSNQSIHQYLDSTSFSRISIVRSTVDCKTMVFDNFCTLCMSMSAFYISMLPGHIRSIIMVLKVFKTLREHWKKSIFFSVVGVYGANYLKGVYRDSLLRTKYCLEAREYGLQPIKDHQKTRKVTVFLNPAAKNGKSRKLFEKNVAPLLFLAGIQVTTVKTEAVGQAKKYMEVVDPADTDAIIVAGGDGTLGEVVTGILRRPDQERFSKIPIGIIPVGHTNTLANAVLKRQESVVEWMAELGMAIIKQTTRPIDVMQIKSSEGKTIYAVSSLVWGEYQDCLDRKSKYWFVGPLKHRLTYIMSTVTSLWPPLKRGEVAVGEKCSGCSRCYTPPPPPPNNLLHKVASNQAKSVPAYAMRENPRCGLLETQPLATIELEAQTQNLVASTPGQARNSMRLFTGPEELTKTQFISEGWSRLRNPVSHLADNLQEVSHFKLTPHLPEGKEVMYNIDNELYEAMPIEVTLLKNKLTLFCPPISKNS